MINVLAPVEVGLKLKRFRPTLYRRIENVMYATFWDVIILDKKDDFDKVKDFSNLGTIFINIGSEHVQGAFNVHSDEVIKALELMEKVVKERQSMNKIKRAKELMLEPVMLDRRMAKAYRKLSFNSLSRISIVIAEDGLLEEWIVWPLLQNAEIMDFSISSEEEMMLRLFGSKNHPSLLSRDGVVLLMNCDSCSEHAISKMARSSAQGFFSPYLSDSRENCLARVIFHFKDEKKIPPFLKQLVGVSISRIPSLHEISESLPMILRVFVTMLAQETKRVNFEISYDLEERIKRSKWNENWKDFLNFCKSFLAGEEKVHTDIDSLESLPKLKDYLKNVHAEAEKELIKRAIKIYGLNKAKLSKVLGVNPKTLTKKLNLYGLEK